MGRIPRPVETMLRWFSIRLALLMTALMAATTIHANDTRMPDAVFCADILQSNSRSARASDFNETSSHHHGGCHSLATTPAGIRTSNGSLSSSLLRPSVRDTQLPFRWFVEPGLRPPISM